MWTGNLWGEVYLDPIADTSQAPSLLRAVPRGGGRGTAPSTAEVNILIKQEKVYQVNLLKLKPKHNTYTNNTIGTMPNTNTHLHQWLILYFQRPNTILI